MSPSPLWESFFFFLPLAVSPGNFFLFLLQVLKEPIRFPSFSSLSFPSVLALLYRSLHFHKTFPFEKQQFSPCLTAVVTRAAAIRVAVIPIGKFLIIFCKETPSSQHDAHSSSCYHAFLNTALCSRAGYALGWCWAFTPCPGRKEQHAIRYTLEEFALTSIESAPAVAMRMALTATAVVVAAVAMEEVVATAAVVVVVTVAAAAATEVVVTACPTWAIT